MRIINNVEGEEDKAKMEKNGSQYFILMFLVSVLMAQEVKANNASFLEVSVGQEVPGELNVGDSIRYILQVNHTSKSTSKANNIKITISLPYYVTFKMVKSMQMNINYDTEINVVTISLVNDLQLGESIKIFYNLTINDVNLSPGRHHVITPVQISHDNAVTNDLLVHDVPIVMTGCNSPIGMTNGSIKYYQLSSTSAYFVSRPEKARYSEGGDAWCATIEDQNQYIQVALAYKTRITALSTKGRLTKESWVQAYHVEFSNDGNRWFMYSENGMPKIFKGNSDQDTEVKSWFLRKIETNYIRIRPLQWTGGMCLRFELFGCTVEQQKNCIDPLGMEDRRIPDEALSHNLEFAVGEPVSSFVNNSRLNKKIPLYPYGWMASSDREEWLQVDLGSLNQITKIAIQGAYSEIDMSSFYVTSFRIQYSKNGMDWDKILEGLEEKLYKGPDNMQQASIPTLVQLQEKIIGRYIRIIPDQYFTFKVMRIELFGCMVEDHFKYQKTPVEMTRRSFLCDGITDDVFICMYKKKKEKSSCHASKDGFKWTAIHPDIVSIISKERNTSRIFGVNRAMQIVMSENLGVDWLSLSENELTRQQKGCDLVDAVHFNDIFPNKLPPKRFRWHTHVGTEWGVSGDGLFKRDSASGPWRMSALWKCCSV